MAGTKIAVMISGRGSNLQSLVNAAKDDDFPGEIALVISNKPNVGGLEIAAKHGIAHHVVSHKDFETREEFDDAVHDHLQRAKIDFVCLAGFMRRLTDNFVSQWRGRLINIHPSLLPSFKGLNVHARMLEAGAKIGGCTVHFVSAEVDDGPIIGQAAVPILPGDDEDSLAARILVQEHKLYPLCLRAVIDGQARISGNVVRLEREIATQDSASFLNPAR